MLRMPRLATYRTGEAAGSGSNTDAPRIRSDDVGVVRGGIMAAGAVVPWGKLLEAAAAAAAARGWGLAIRVAGAVFSPDIALPGSARPTGAATVTAAALGTTDEVTASASRCCLSVPTGPSQRRTTPASSQSSTRAWKRGSLTVKNWAAVVKVGGEVHVMMPAEANSNEKNTKSP